MMPGNRSPIQFVAGAAIVAFVGVGAWAIVIGIGVASWKLIRYFSGACA